MRIPAGAKKLSLSAALIALVLVACWVYLSKEPSRLHSLKTASESNEHSTTASPVGLASGIASNTSTIESVARSLNGNADRKFSAQSIEQLRTDFKALDPQAASAVVQKWLDSGEDAPTHLDFKLSADGSLKEAPTLRTFLLDYLAQADPKVAAGYAEKILNSQNSSDEWAVALRAYARGNSSPEAQSFLQRKTREMLTNQEWRDHPSAGFLEAFDVAVYTRDKELTPDLAGFVRQRDNRALAHAAYLTLDRLVQTVPSDVLDQLRTQPELMDGHEQTRADFLARADVRDAQQKAILENYLLEPNRSVAELQQFAGVFPNANFMVSYNLLTQTTTPSREDLTARDRESLKVIQQWLEDSRFARLSPHLQTIKGRLEQFVKQASASQP